jgi:predicted membrane-bound spermidine synthase
MPLNTVAIAALLFGLILEVSAANLYRQGRPKGETLPLVIVGAVFLVGGLVRLLD